MWLLDGPPNGRIWGYNKDQCKLFDSAEAATEYAHLTLTNPESKWEVVVNGEPTDEEKE